MKETAPESYLDAEEGVATVTAEARGKIREAKKSPAKRLKEETDEAEVSLIRLRDLLIGRLRSGDGDSTRAEREALDRVNTALSLVVGVEYPHSGIHRKTLEEAEKLLDRVLQASAGVRP